MAATMCKTWVMGMVFLVLSVQQGHADGPVHFQVSKCRGCDAMSSGGLVVERTISDGSLRLFVWNTTKPTAAPQELAVPNTPWLLVECINDAGLVVAHSSRLGSAELHPLLWDTKHPTTLPKELVVPEGTSGRARAINNKGLIAGDFSKDDEEYAVLWNANGSAAAPVALVTPKGRKSHVNAINDKGLVVGRISMEDSHRAVVWDANDTTAPPKFLATPAGTSSYACAINANGQVVGCLRSKNGDRPALWDANDPNTVPKRLAEVTGLEDLIPFNADRRFVLRGINDQGQIVGSVRLYSKGPQYIMSDSYPILWDRAKAVHLDQQFAGFEGELACHRFKNVMAINNMGQIIIVYKDEFNHQERTYLLTPSTGSDGRASKSAKKP